jgi:phospholipid-binding lipoprotein MlaA
MLSSLSRLQRLKRTSVILLGVVAAAMSTGCATTATNATNATAKTNQQDPFEPVNRKVFAFNEGFDEMVLKPTATAYKKVVPTVVQTGVSNFFSNLQNPWSSVNMVLQGRVKEGATTAARFGVNTTVGVLGLFDVADAWGIQARGSEDFGLTLDTWGVGSGPYVVLPLLGPSNVRDALTIPVNSMADPKGQIADIGVRNSMTALQLVKKRSEMLGMGNLVDQAALDKYVFIRDAQMQRRNRSAHESRNAEQHPDKSDEEGHKPYKGPEQGPENGEERLAPSSPSDL